MLAISLFHLSDEHPSKSLPQDTSDLPKKPEGEGESYRGSVCVCPYAYMQLFINQMSIYERVMKLPCVCIRTCRYPSPCIYIYHV